MRALCFSMLMLIALSLNAAEITIKPLSYKRAASGESLDGYDIPFFKVESQDLELANKINQLVYLDRLGILPPKDEKTKVAAPGTTYIVPAGLEQNGKYISISLDAEGCGAYCEGYTVYYVFDANTGYRISINDLIKKEAKSALKNNFEKQRKKAIKQQISQIQADIKKGNHDYIDMVHVYKECLKSDYGPSDLYIKNNKLILMAGRCSNHAMRALDDIGDFSFAYSQSQLEPYLTPYGQWLLSSDELPPISNQINPTNIDEKLLKGKIGNANITLWLKHGFRVLSDNNDSLSGQYFYSKYQTPIELFGELKNGRMILSENHEAENVKATMQLNFVKDDKLLLKGYWQSGDKKLPVEIYK